MLWIILVLIYSLLKGCREIVKKLALNKNAVIEVLFAYTIVSCIFVLPQMPHAGGLELKYYFLIALKSFVIFLAWLCGFNSLKKLPISIYGVLDLSRVLFLTLLGIIFLNERLNIFQFLGLLVVCVGLIMLKFSKAQKMLPQTDIETNTSKRTYIFLAFASCLLNAISGLMDKILMKDISSSQLQFWYMLFLVLFYVIYIMLTKTKISFGVFKNMWIWILAFMFVIGDKALFIANGMAQSRVTTMTLIKQSCCIVSIVGGHFVFKEKGTLYALFCAVVIICGIALGLINI